MSHHLPKKITGLLLCCTLLFSSIALFGQSPPAIHDTDKIKIDNLIGRFMKKWDLKGGQFSIGNKNQIAYSKGYGFADDDNTPVTNTHRFRIASLSKTFTAVAVMQLVEQGKIKLETTIFSISSCFGEFIPYLADQRLKKITIRMLLHHLGGWDRAIGGDPVFKAAQISQATNTPLPASKETMIRYVTQTLSLDHNPGNAFAYSNFGYLLLGKIIECFSDKSYEEYIQQYILAKITGLGEIKIGKSLDQAPNEVHYYDYKGAPQVASAFDPKTMVDAPYGSFDLAAMDAFGGWIATSDDLVKYLFALEQPQPVFFSKKDTRDTLLKTAPHSGDYAMGLEVEAGMWFHNGSLAGSSSEMLHNSNGYDCAILFNGRPKNEDAFKKEMKELLVKIANTIKIN